MRMYKEGYLSVKVFLNIDNEQRRFYDTVIYRKVKKDGGASWERGTNLKPGDLLILSKLLREAYDFIQNEQISGQ